MSTDNPQNRDLITDEPGSHPVGTGVGTLAGAAAGAAAGAIAGPAGIIIGAVAGGVAGALAGHHVGEGVNPSEGVLTDDENSVGTGMGSTAGAIAGGIIGTAAGPLGTAAGAAIGAGLGGFAGEKAEAAYDNRTVDDHDYKNQVFADRITQSSPPRVLPKADDTVVSDVTYVETAYVPEGNTEPFRGEVKNSTIGDKDYKKSDIL